MVRVLRSTIVSAPIDAVWAVLRDFNGHDRWHPNIMGSRLDRELYSDRVGCVRSVRLADGTELRERLLTLSDIDCSYSYCLLDTPLPLFNCVTHVRLLPVTDADHTFCEWLSRFDVPKGREAELEAIVGDKFIQGGFEAMRKELEGVKAP